jgi:orotate phosphoribosyltransferase
MKVIVVEDLISTGGSSLECVDALKDAGCEVIGMVAIFTYGLPKATANFNDKQCSFHTLTNYDALIEVAVENQYIQESDLIKLKSWKENPNDESWMEK